MEDTKIAMLLSQLAELNTKHIKPALPTGPQRRCHTSLFLWALVILELRRRPEQFHCTVISTGQHAAMLTQVLKAFDLGDDAVDLPLDLTVQDQTLGGLTSRVMDRMDQILLHNSGSG